MTVKSLKWFKKVALVITVLHCMKWNTSIILVTHVNIVSLVLWYANNPKGQVIFIG